MGCCELQSRKFNSAIRNVNIWSMGSQSSFGCAHLRCREWIYICSNFLSKKRRKKNHVCTVFWKKREEKQHQQSKQANITSNLIVFPPLFIGWMILILAFDLTMEKNRDIKLILILIFSKSCLFDLIIFACQCQWNCCSATNLMEVN